MSQENYTLLCDYYELTMANGYFELGRKDEIAYFDVFFRTIPDGGGFAIFAGLEQLIDYVRNLCFTEEDIRFLRAKGIFSEGFLEYLRTFRFSGDIFQFRISHGDVPRFHQNASSRGFLHYKRTVVSVSCIKYEQSDNNCCLMRRR